jgi:pimeloyl-ACP methyl ester carboxylesterase
MTKQLKLFFIHGAGGTISKWRKVIERLGDTPFEVHNLPGHDNDMRALPSTIEEFASMLNSEIKEDIIVVGHSMGGLIGIELAAINEKVKGLVLANSHYELPVHPKILQQLSTGVFPESFFYASYGKNVDKQLLYEEKEELHKNPMRVTINDFECCAKYTTGKEVLALLNIPVLAVFGEEDKLVPPKATEQLVKVKPDIQIKKIEGAGHYSMLEKSEMFTEIILAFRNAVQQFEASYKIK